MNMRKISLAVISSIITLSAMEKAVEIPAATANFQFTEHIGSVNLAIFGPNDKYVITASDDKTALLCDLTQIPVTCQKLLGHTHSVFLAAFSADGKFAATGGAENKVRLWDLSASPAVCKESIVAGDILLGIGFTPCSKHLVIGVKSKTFKVWNLTSFPLSCKTYIHKHSLMLAVACSPKGAYFATANSAMIKLWDYIPGTSHRSFAISWGPITMIAFSPDGKYVVAVANKSIAQFYVWNIYNTTHIPMLKQNDNPGPISSIAFSGDSRYLLTPAGNHARLWDLSKKPISLQVLKGHNALITSVALCKIGCHALTGSSDGVIRIWDLSKNPPLSSALAAHADAITSLNFSTMGCYFLSSSKDGKAILWDVK